MKIAFFSPMPPSKSGIADYSAALVEPLSELADVESSAEKPSGFEPASFDIALYQIGNNGYHSFVYEQAHPDARRRRDARIEPASPDCRAHHQAERLGRVSARSGVSTAGPRRLLCADACALSKSARTTTAFRC